MADEKDKEKKPEAAPEEKKGAAPEGKSEGAAPAAGAPAAKASPLASPWLPVLVVMVLSPILTLVISEALILPRVKKTLGDIAQIQKENAQPAEGGPLPTEKKKEAKKGEKKKEGGKEGEAGDGSTQVKFDNVVANLLGSQKTRFVKVSFSIEGEEDDFKKTIEENRNKLIDSALGILGALTVAELDEPGMKNIIRSDLVNSFNQVLGKPMVKGLYFSEFVIQ